MKAINYTPPPTLAKFMRSEAAVRAVRGPVGSAKSTACVFELFRRAAAQEPGADGIRRTRMAIIRNTLPQLKTTCLETVMNFLRPVAEFRPSTNTIQIRAGDIHTDWLLIPMDTEQNVQRLLSLDLTMVWASEFRELKPDVIFNAFARCGRYPRVDVPPTFFGVIMETNSFSEDSPWNEILEVDLPEGWAYFVQPGGLEPEAENVENLPVGYYQNMVQMNPPEWVDQYVHNKITPSLAGTAVFKDTFSTTFHVKQNLKPRRGQPLIIGVDTGRVPAAVITQMDEMGVVRVFQELYLEDAGMEKFVRERLTPTLMNDERFRGMSHYLVVDPAGVSRGEIGEESVIDALQRLGFAAYPAMTNNISPRIRVVEKFLLGQRQGEPMLQLDGDHCPMLIEAMRSKYRYKQKKDGSLEDKPDKSLRPWVDIVDSCQYALLGTSNIVRAQFMHSATPETPPPVASWT